MNFLYSFKYDIVKFLFLFNSDKRQNCLIDKNAIKFLTLQNDAKKYDYIGDVKTSLYLSSKSYKYLVYFTIYCEIKNIDQVKRLKTYTM